MSTLVHIHAPKGHYIGQVRRYGHQKWETVTMPTQRAELAMANAVQSMSADHHRARVLFIADWYEPNVVMEAKR
jgi:hypothetical protein